MTKINYKMNLRFATLIGGSLTALAMAIATPAMASEADAAQVDAADEDDVIVVTAQFRNQNLQDTPISMTAVNADMLDARGQVTVTDIAQSVPNLSLKPYTAGPAITAFIRGVGQSDTNAAVEPGVGLYVDDVYYATLVGSQVDLLDIDRVEVLRGPQGTLSGRNSIGGAVKIFSQKPGPETNGFLSVGYGAYDRIEARGGASFTIAEDSLFGRVSGVYKSKKGYVTSYDYGCTHPGSGVPAAMVSGQDCVIGKQGGINLGGVRAALRWVASDGIEINLAADYTRDRSEPVANTMLAAFTSRGGGVGPTIGGVDFVIPLVTPVIPGVGRPGSSPYLSYSPFAGIVPGDTFTNSPYANYSTYCDSVGRPANPGTGATAYYPYCLQRTNDLDIYGFSGTIDAELSDTLALKSITAYRAYNSDYAFDQDMSPVKTSLTSNIYSHWQFSQELRLSGTIADVANFTVGGIYNKQTTTLGGRLNLGAFDTVNNEKVPQSSKAVFAHVDWEIVPDLNVIGAVRYTSEKKNYIFDRRASNGDPISTIPLIAGFATLVPQVYTGDHTDFRLGLQYRFSPDFMAYGQFATGFKGGGVNPRPFSAAQVKPFNIEETKAWELGFKSTFFDRRLRLNGAIFTNDYSDIQITVLSCPTLDPLTPPCAAPINAGRATLRGGELEATIEPVDGFIIDASGSLVDFKYKSLTSEALASGINLASKGPFVIEKKLSIGAQYEIGLGDAGSLTPRVDMAYQSGFFAAAGNDPYNYVAGNTIMNARLSWRNADKDLEMALSVSNLTDKLYYNTYFDNRNSSQTMVGAPAAPREWFFNIKKSF